jgi:hypothetical protein
VNAVRSAVAGAGWLTAPFRSPRAAGIAAVLVALLASLAVASTWHVFGHTWDEPEHLAAGLALLDQGRYPYDIQHPPIARVAMALGPWLAGARSQGKLPPDGRPEGVAILYGEGHYQLYLTLARAAMLPFFWLLLAVTWFWARDSGASPGQALLAVAAAASTPPLLGHAGLAALDLPAAATTLLALWLMARWMLTGLWGEALWFGLAAGVAVGTKLSAIPFLAVGFLALLAVVHWCGAAGPLLGARARNLPRAIRQGLAASGLVILVLIAAYGGQWLWLTDSSHHYNHALNYLLGASGRAHDAAYAVAAHVPVPSAFPLVLGGIEALTVHNANGHPSFLLGEVRTTGWWYFYIVALAVKTPLPLLVLGLAGLGVAARDGCRDRAPWQLAPAVLFVALLAFASAASRINIGVRHLLILYPLLALGAAYASVRVWRAVEVSSEPGAPMLAAFAGAALAWLLVTPLVVFPDYLAYFNAAAPHPERVLIDSDLDWGQDLRRLERRLLELHVPSVSLAYLGTADLAREPLPAMTRLPPGTPATGWVAITALARQRGGAGYQWLDRYPPVEKVGKSIWLYDIPADDAGRAP